VTAPAAPTIREALPDAAAPAVVGSITRPMLDNPSVEGAALRNESEGIRSARRGTYRFLNSIDDERDEVIVLRVGIAATSPSAVSHHPSTRCRSRALSDRSDTRRDQVIGASYPRRLEDRAESHPRPDSVPGLLAHGLPHLEAANTVAVGNVTGPPRQRRLQERSRTTRHSARQWPRQLRGEG
jgi:mRNA-degrading endonuclease RelE of RelBE toxin-antitoxin system